MTDYPDRYPDGPHEDPLHDEPMSIDDFLDRWKVLHERRKHAHHQGRAWAFIQMDTSVVGFEWAEARSRADRWARVEHHTEHKIHKLIQEYQRHADVEN